MPNLIVQADDNSTLRSKTDCIRAEKNMTIRGIGKLTLETPENGILTQSLVEPRNLDLEINAGEKGITGEKVGTPRLRVIRSNLEIDMRKRSSAVISYPPSARTCPMISTFLGAAQPG